MQQTLWIIATDSLNHRNRLFESLQHTFGIVATHLLQHTSSSSSKKNKFRNIQQTGKMTETNVLNHCNRHFKSYNRLFESLQQTIEITATDSLNHRNRRFKSLQQIFEITATHLLQHASSIETGKWIWIPKEHTHHCTHPENHCNRLLKSVFTPLQQALKITATDSSRKHCNTLYK